MEESFEEFQSERREVHELSRFSGANQGPAKNTILEIEKSSQRNRNTTFPIILINEEETTLIEVKSNYSNSYPVICRVPGITFIECHKLVIIESCPLIVVKFPQQNLSLTPI